MMFVYFTMKHCSRCCFWKILFVSHVTDCSMFSNIQEIKDKYSPISLQMWHFFINLQLSKLEKVHSISSNKMLTKILRGLCLFFFCNNISCFSVPYRHAHGSIAVHTFTKASFCCVIENSCFKSKVKKEIQRKLGYVYKYGDAFQISKEVAQTSHGINCRM